MQETLPKLGREKMENFNSECRTIKDMIDYELKTTEDYINNMDIKEKLEERLRALQVLKDFFCIFYLNYNYFYYIDDGSSSLFFWMLFN